VQAVLGAGAGRDVLSYRTLKVLADLDPAVARSAGSPATASTARHDLDHRPRWHLARPPEPCRTGCAELRGTKHRVATEREVLVGSVAATGAP
jgi:glucosamine--fructose-6-phosphate aminotransferase (isomerizing)